MLSYIRRTRRNDEQGASAVEYGLMVAAIAAVIVGVVFALGTFVNGAFQSTCVAVASGNKADATDCGVPAAPPVAP
jgi:pilus assembly protein Flp/PilA